MISKQKNPFRLFETANKANKEDAIEFVKNFNPLGATFTDDALKEAFKVKDADTIYFLTDGMPNKAALRQFGFQTPTTSQILEIVRDLNATRRLKINTFGFIDRTARAKVMRNPAGQTWAEFVEFLKTLAKENQGKFREIR